MQQKQLHVSVVMHTAQIVCPHDYLPRSLSIPNCQSDYRRLAVRQFDSAMIATFMEIPA